MKKVTIVKPLTFILTLLIGGIGHAKQNQIECDRQRREMRQNILDALDIPRLLRLHDEFFKNADRSDLKAIHDLASKVSTSPKAKLQSDSPEKSFMALGQKILRNRNNFDSYTYTPVKFNDEPISAARYEDPSGFRQTILFDHPSLQFGRKLLRPSPLGIQSLKNQDWVVATILDDFRTLPPTVEYSVTTKKDSKQKTYNLSGLVEINLDPGCRKGESKYDGTFDWFDSNEDLVAQGIAGSNSSSKKNQDSANK